jgi:hypothetical protein
MKMDEETEKKNLMKTGGKGRINNVIINDKNVVKNNFI